MEDLVAVINKLQEVVSLLGQDTLSLPQIVVVGDQSSGKSSVLESIVGQSFLPRGMGIATRRPLILQLVRKNENELKDAADCGVFLHDKERIYTDFNKIRDEITAETVRKAGPHKDINPEPIILKIFSTKVSTLTMVDLPGIVKVAVGDQPADVECVVKALILKYISNLNSIILAVVTANTDMATCESLKIAKEVDPNFDRTIAVVTKLDLMDAGTNAFDILTGKVIPVKLGIIGVVNRSHLHTLEGKRISDAVRDEAHFLRCMYPTIAYMHGIPALARTLHKILLSRIESCLPQLKHRIKTATAHYQNLLGTLGVETKEPMKLLLETLTKYSSTYRNKITGAHDELVTEELTGGARISYIFLVTYGNALSRVDPLENLNRAAIVTAMRNATGVKSPFFISETCFELLVKKQVEKLEAPSLACVELIRDELERIILDVGPQMSITLARFPNLQKKIKTITSDLIRSQVDETNEMVKNQVKIHTAYINTSHPDFLRDRIEILSELRDEQHVEANLPMVCMGNETSSNHPIEENPPKECILIEKLIISYFNVIRRSVQDSVPKTIMHFLVNHVMEHLSSRLVSQLYNMEASQSLFEESQSATEQRKSVAALLKAYKQADQVLCDLKESPCSK